MSLQCHQKESISWACTGEAASYLQIKPDQVLQVNARSPFYLRETRFAYKERRLSLEQSMSSSSTQMLQALVSTALPPNAVALHLFGIEHQCLF